MAKLHIIVNKAVDSYHRVGQAFDVPDDSYHQGLLDLGYLTVVEEPKKKKSKKTDEPKPEVDSE